MIMRHVLVVFFTQQTSNGHAQWKKLATDESKVK